MLDSCSLLRMSREGFQVPVTPPDSAGFADDTPLVKPCLETNPHKLRPCNVRRHKPNIRRVRGSGSLIRQHTCVPAIRNLSASSESLLAQLDVVREVLAFAPLKSENGRKSRDFPQKKPQQMGPFFLDSHKHAWCVTQQPASNCRRKWSRSSIVTAPSGEPA